MIGTYFDPLLNKVSKFNPNHGEDGRFASEGSSSTLSESMDAGAKRLQDDKAKAVNANALAAGFYPNKPGEVDAIVDHLKHQGYSEEKNLNVKEGQRFFSMGSTAHTDGQAGYVHHMVMVSPNGSWQQTMEGSHQGNSLADLKNMQSDFGQHLPDAEKPAPPAAASTAQPSQRMKDIMAAGRAMKPDNFMDTVAESHKEPVKPKKPAYIEGSRPDDHMADFMAKKSQRRRA